MTLAGDGERACAELHAAPRAFDVVLMDVQMPVLDGFSATKRIRDELGLADLPVIALTAGALVSERQRAVAVGMNEFITKPFSPADLVHVIRRHVPPQDGAREGSALHADDPAPPRTTSRWPALPGIDIEDASLRLGGDWALFRSMLKRLLEEFSDIGIVAETTDPADRVAHAARLHKLRGCAGSLGAKEIHRVAGQAEAAYLAQDAAQAERLARQIGTQLGRLGKDAASLFEGPAPDDDAAASGEDDPQALIAFTRLLRQHSLAALDELPRVGPLLRRALGRTSFGVLRDLVENLSFEEAAEMVEQRLTQAA